MTKDKRIENLNPHITSHAVTYRDPYSLRRLCVTREDWDTLVAALQSGRPFHQTLSTWTKTTNAVEVPRTWL